MAGRSLAIAGRSLEWAKVRSELRMHGVSYALGYETHFFGVSRRTGYGGWRENRFVIAVSFASPEGRRRRCHYCVWCGCVCMCLQVYA